jgi:hypothetical protein
MRRRLSGPVPTLGRVAVLAQLLAALGFVAFLLSAEGVRVAFSGGGEC